MLLIEIITSLALLALIITGSAGVQSLSSEVINKNKSYREAYAIAQHKIDEARQLSRYEDFNILHSITTHESHYETSVTESIKERWLKQVDVTVKWRNHTVNLSTTLTDTSSTLSSINCTASGDWHEPDIIGVLDLDSGNNTSGIAVWGNMAFITANSSRATDPDLYIVDIETDNHPRLISTLNTGPGLADIQVDGRYIYAANTSINAQLQIIDILDPSLPRLVKNYKLPGNYKDNTTIGHKLSISGRKLYLGTPKSEVGEIHIIDITDPLNPQQLNEIEIGAGINAMRSKNGLLYIATPRNEELHIFDVSRPSQIEQYGSMDLLGGSGNGKSLALLGSMVYIGRTYGAIELYAIKTETPLLKVFDTYDVNTNITALEAAPGLLFGGTTGSPKFQIWNLKNGIAYEAGLHFTGDPTDIHCHNGNVIVITENPAELIIISNKQSEQ